MIIHTDIRNWDPDDIAFRRLALRNSVICLGWLKLVSVSCYIMLYFLVRGNSKGEMAAVLQHMTLATIIPQILEGTVLLMGALEQKICAIEISLWLCLLMGSYNTVLGVFGSVYFIRTGYLTMHFLLAIVFIILALSIFTVLCHDIVIIYSYKRLLMTL